MFTLTEATIVGAGIGGLLTLIAGGAILRVQRSDRRTEIRRDAYAALIVELDYLERIWEAPETLAVPGDEKLRDTTGVAVGRIQQTYAAVRLVGSDKARDKAKAALDAAWDLSNLFHTPHRTSEFLEKFGPTLDAFTAAARDFVKQAEAEVAR
jgi:hypothetical protein